MVDRLLLLGVLLVVALVFGGLSRHLRMPRVVGYLLGGLAIAAGALWLLPALGIGGAHPAGALLELLVDLDPIEDVALGFIMFDIGARFEVHALRRTVRAMLPISLLEMGATAGLVAAGMLAVGARWQVAALLAVMAMATAPITTILVIRQYESEGPLTQHINTLLAFNNAVSILLFGLLFILVEPVGPRSVAHHVATRMLWDVLGSAVIGLVGGGLVSYYYERVAVRVRATLLIAVLLAAIGLCRTIGVPFLLSLLMLGVVMANTTEYQREIRQILDGVASPFYVLFFVAAGARLDIHAIGAIGLMGAAYVVLRTVGKLGGAWLGARIAGSPQGVRRLLGFGLLSQAGAAVGPAILASHRDPALGYRLFGVLLAPVVVFEIAGPILLKIVLVRSGEVKLVNFLEHSPKPGYLSSVRTLLVRFGDALGVGLGGAGSLATLRVRDVMITNVSALHQRASFREVIDYVEHSRHGLFPVVDEGDVYLGYISYRSLQGLMMDPSLGHLLIARDLMETRDVHLLSDSNLETALARFDESGLDVLPVLDPEQDRVLVGLIERREVLRLLRRKIRKAHAATASDTRGTASPTHGTASPTHGTASPSHGTASRDGDPA